MGGMKPLSTGVCRIRMDEMQNSIFFPLDKGKAYHL